MDARLILQRSAGEQSRVALDECDIFALCFQSEGDPGAVEAAADYDIVEGQLNSGIRRMTRHDRRPQRWLFDAEAPNPTGFRDELLQLRRGNESHAPGIKLVER